jgi:chromosomal replication initiation ATPase DnaA
MTTHPIQSAICQTFKVTPEQLASRSRKRKVAEARFACIARLHESGCSKRKLASMFGMRRFAIAYAIQRVSELRTLDTSFEFLYSHTP